MKEKLVRWKFYFDKDKEEQWLNEMADKGWNMKKTVWESISLSILIKDSIHIELIFCRRMNKKKRSI